MAISIESQDEFFHPRRSYLLVEGELVKEDGTRYIANDDIALCNNGIMHLFSNAKYEIAGQEIEKGNADERQEHPRVPEALAGMVRKRRWPCIF